MTSLQFNLVQVAKKNGGDKYVCSTNNSFTIYFPQTFSRVNGQAIPMIQFIMSEAQPQVQPQVQEEIQDVLLALEINEVPLAILEDVQIFEDDISDEDVQIPLAPRAQVPMALIETPLEHTQGGRCPNCTSQYNYKTNSTLRRHQRESCVRSTMA